MAKDNGVGPLLFLSVILCIVFMIMALTESDNPGGYWAISIIWGLISFFTALTLID